MTTLVEDLEKAAADFEATQSYLGNHEDADGDDINHDMQGEMLQAAVVARKAAVEITRLTQTVEDQAQALGQEKDEITRLQADLDAKGKRELKVLNLIDKLREPEGHSVTLFCDNPDFNGQPNCAIEVCGDWTGWEDKRFPGDTVLEALEKAHACAVFFPAPPSKPQR